MDEIGSIAKENLLSVTKTTENFTDSILKAILSLFSDTLRYAFIHVGGNIIDLLEFKTKTVMLDIKGGVVRVS